jgi:PIN domain nuclease of toxin-antitoxin system
MRASSVKAYGSGLFNALNQQRIGFSPVDSASRQQANGSGIIHLSPEDRQLLRQALDRPVNLYTDNTVIAKSANAGNQVLAQRGLK